MDGLHGHPWGLRKIDFSKREEKLVDPCWTPLYVLIKKRWLRKGRYE